MGYFVYSPMELDDLFENPELERLGTEDFILKEAYNNSYQMLVLGVTLGEITDRGNIFFLAHDALAENHDEDLKGMLEYFEDEEDYEKCIEVKKLLIK